MVRLSARLKFLVINLDDIVILLIALSVIYWLLPLYFLPIASVLLVGFVIFIFIKYRLLYTVLDDTSRNYDVTEMMGEALSTITSTEGKIRIGQEIWHARTRGEEISVGTPVRVVSRDGMTLLVVPVGTI